MHEEEEDKGTEDMETVYLSYLEIYDTATCFSNKTHNSFSLVLVTYIKDSIKWAEEIMQGS